MDGSQTPDLVPTDVLITPGAETPLATAAPTAAPVPANSAFAVDTLAPIVQLTVQDPGLPVSFGQSVALNVLAADNTTVTKLELYDNNILYAQAPVILSAPVYSNQFVWKAGILGKHTLRAIAYDAAGNVSEPAQIELTVINNNRAPEVQITAPQGTKNAELGAPLVIQGVATDDVAVTRIELVVDNQVITFVQPDQPGGVTPYAVAIPWTPTTTGAHNVVLRAYDNQNQSDDSLRYTIHVFDNQPPVITAQTDTTALAFGDALVVNALALSNNGITRVELYIDEQLADAVNSSSPSQQTSMQVALSAPDLSVGNHSYFVRAYDFTGETTDTPHSLIQIVEGAPHVIRQTPLPQNTRAPLLPTPTATPQLNIPAPPTIQLALTNAPVTLPGTAKIQITASGSSELDTVELWVRAPGETSAQLVSEENVQGATEKTLTYDWSAPRAGVVEMYARVTDSLKQSRVSTTLDFSVSAPPVPTPAPAVFNFAQTWFAESPAARFEATFTQIGHALRGTFLELRTNGTILQGKIVNGAVTEKTALFGIDFSADPSAPQHTLEFDCTFNARPPVLTCNYANENDERGSAIFQPLAP